MSERGGGLNRSQQHTQRRSLLTALPRPGRGLAWFWVAVRRLGWFALSDAEKADAQRVSGLSEKDALLRILHRRVARSLRKMPTGPSSDCDGVLANLRVAERLIAPEENGIVYAILSRAVRDLGAIRGAS